MYQKKIDAQKSIQITHKHLKRGPFGGMALVWWSPSSSGEHAKFICGPSSSSRELPLSPWQHVPPSSWQQLVLISYLRGKIPKDIREAQVEMPRWYPGARSEAAGQKSWKCSWLDQLGETCGEISDCQASELGRYAEEREKVGRKLKFGTRVA